MIRSRRCKHYYNACHSYNDRHSRRNSCSYQPAFGMSAPFSLLPLLNAIPEPLPFGVDIGHNSLARRKGMTYVETFRKRSLIFLMIM